MYDKPVALPCGTTAAVVAAHNNSTLHYPYTFLAGIAEPLLGIWYRDTDVVVPYLAPLPSPSRGVTPAAARSNLSASVVPRVSPLRLVAMPSSYSIIHGRLVVRSSRAADLNLMVRLAPRPESAARLGAYTTALEPS